MTSGSIQTDTHLSPFIEEETFYPKVEKCFLIFSLTSAFFPLYIAIKI